MGRPGPGGAIDADAGWWQSAEHDRATGPGIGSKTNVNQKHIYMSGAALAAVITLATVPAHAKPVLLEGITAQVGDEIILESEVYEQVAFARMQYEVPDSALTALREEVIKRMIDEKIIVQEARAQGVTVSTAEVEQAVQGYMARIKESVGGEAALERELAKEGITYEELLARYRQQARQEMLYGRLVQREIYSKIEVTDEEVEQYYAEHKDQLPQKQEQVRLSHVFLGVRPADEAIESAQNRLDEVRRRVDAGEDFGSIAAELSDDVGTKDDDGDLGWIRRGSLDPTFEEVAFGLAEGEVSDPFQTANGVEMLRVSERDDAGDRVRVQHILVLLRATEDDVDRSRARAEKVLRLANSGIDFAQLAREYSDDADSADKGGDLGVFEVPDLVPFVATAVKDLGVGEFSEVVQTDQGLHVFKVTERKAGGPFTLAEVYEQLRQAIIEERAAELTEEWLAEVRTNYYVSRSDGVLPWMSTEGQQGARPAGSGAQVTIQQTGSDEKP